MSSDHDKYERLQEARKRWNKLGKQIYITCAVEFKNRTGKGWPFWEKLPEKERDYWRAEGQRTVQEFPEKYLPQ